MEAFFATEPDTTSTVFAGITKADKVRPARNELGALGGSIGDELEHSPEIKQGTVSVGTRWHLDVLPTGLGRVVAGKEPIKWSQEAFAIGDAKAGMLEFANNGLKVRDRGMAPHNDSLDCIANLLEFARGELNSAVDAIKDPPQNLFSKSPDALTLMELLEGDRLIIRVAFWIGACWEN